jgi:hypothetical protein
MIEFVQRDYQVTRGCWIGDRELPRGERILVLWSVVTDILTAAENPDWPELQMAEFPQ